MIELDPSLNSLYPSIAIDNEGTIYVAYENNEVIYMVIKTISGSWTTPGIVSERGTNPSIRSDDTYIYLNFTNNDKITMIRFLPADKYSIYIPLSSLKDFIDCVPPSYNSSIIYDFNRAEVSNKMGKIYSYPDQIASIIETLSVNGSYDLLSWTGQIIQNYTETYEIYEDDILIYSTNNLSYSYLCNSNIPYYVITKYVDLFNETHSTKKSNILIFTGFFRLQEQEIYNNKTSNTISKSYNYLDFYVTRSNQFENYNNISGNSISKENKFSTFYPIVDNQIDNYNNISGNSISKNMNYIDYYPLVIQ